MVPENPSITEIEEWAYSNEDWPHSEWPLFLSWKNEIKVYIDFATNHKCPKQDFFRFMLYYIVGYVYDNPQKPKSEIKEEILHLIFHGKGIKHGEIRKWVMKSRELILNELTFTYEDWRGGVLANYDSL